MTALACHKILASHDQCGKAIAGMLIRDDFPDTPFCQKHLDEWADDVRSTGGDPYRYWEWIPYDPRDPIFTPHTIHGL